MSQDKEAAKGFQLFNRLRDARDSLMGDWAKVTLAVTSTHLYQAANALVAGPTLLASALLKEKRDAAMSDLLGQLNMPSRDDVLTLSQRLTRIEMVLDDVSAGLDQLRRPAGRTPRPAGREASNGSTPTGKEA